MFHRWIDFYRDYDQNLYTELRSLFTRYDIPHRAHSRDPDSRMAAFGAEPGGVAGNGFRRVAYANPGLLGAVREAEEAVNRQLYIIRIRRRDLQRALTLCTEYDLGGN